MYRRRSRASNSNFKRAMQAGRRRRIINQRGDETPPRQIGVQRVIYPLNTAQERNVSIYQDPVRDFDTFVELSASGYESFVLCEEEWDALVRASDTIETHLSGNVDMKSDSEAHTKLSDLYYISYESSWSRRVVFIKSAQPTLKKKIPMYMLTSATWTALKNLAPVVAHALFARKKWRNHARRLFEGVHKNYTNILHERCIDVGDIGGMRNEEILKAAMEQAVTDDAAASASYHSSFDTHFFLKEIFVYYATMF